MSLRSLKLPTIDFVNKRKYAIVFSVLLLIVSIISLGLQGLKLGIDFTGGTLIEVGYQQTADLEDIRTKLASANYSGTNVQYFGSDTEVLIQLEPQSISSAKLSSSIIQMLGETVAEAAQRELLEETGIKVDPLLLVDVVDAIIPDDEGKIKYHYTLVDYMGQWHPGEPTQASPP